jgi:hypothetical protein
LLLSTGSDTNNGLSYAASAANRTIDGPLLYGNSGGALGTNQSFPSTTSTAALFDGTSGFITLTGGLPAKDFSAGITLEAWARFDSFQSWSRILDFGGGPISDNIIFCNANNAPDLWLAISKGTGPQSGISAAGVLLQGVWQHLCATVSADGFVAIYVNGVQVAATSLSSPTGSFQLPSGTAARTKCYIGQSSWAPPVSTDQLFKGALAHVRVWSRALPPSEVYRNSLPSYVPAVDSSLWLYYKLDNPSSITNSAPSGPAVSGTVTGSVTSTSAPPASPSRCGLTWDALGNAATDGCFTAKGGLMIGADSGLADKTLYLRAKPSGSDQFHGWDPNHGLGYFGYAKPFAGVNVDGPALFGNSGGALGSTAGTQKIALSWDANQFVHIGSNPINFTSSWQASTDAGGATNVAEISNDTSTYHALILAGNRSATPAGSPAGTPGPRSVTIFDTLTVNTNLATSNGGASFYTYCKVGTTLSVNGASTLTGGASIGANSWLNNSILYFRAGAPGGSGNDTNSGLGYNGSGVNFGGSSLDGPVLFGNVGGLLGSATYNNGSTTSATTHWALGWDNAGTVTVPGTFSVGTVKTTGNVITGGNPLYLTSTYAGATGNGTNYAEICNETATPAYQCLMLVGNSSSGTHARRVVGVWDDLKVAGNVTTGGGLTTSGNISTGALTTSSNLITGVNPLWITSSFSFATSNGTNYAEISNDTGGNQCLMLVGNTSSGNHTRRVVGVWDDLKVAGTLTAATKNFVIPHPADPKRKLVHSAMEGPEVGVYYRGEAQLQDGKALIELPSYFELLTRKESRTVLVTPIFEEDDEPISQLAATAVRDGKFRVRGIDAKNPAQRFHWEVKAIRADQPLLEVEPPAQETT